MAKKEKRFVKTYSQEGGFTGNHMSVYVDRQTGVNYLYSAAGYSGGMTVLVDRDGKPIITPIPNQYDE